MKQLLFLFLLFGLLLAACSSEEESTSSAMLTAEKGKYVFLFLHEETTPQQKVSDMVGRVLDKAEDMEVFHEAIVTANTDKYGMEVDSLPAFILIDSKEIVLKASSAEEVIDYLEHSGE